MSVMISVSKPVSRKQLNLLPRRTGLWRVQYAALELPGLEGYPPQLPYLTQIISRNGAPFSMDVFRKVYDVNHYNAVLTSRLTSMERTMYVVSWPRISPNSPRKRAMSPLAFSSSSQVYHIKTDKRDKPAMLPQKEPLHPWPCPWREILLDIRSECAPSHPACLRAPCITRWRRRLCRYYLLGQNGLLDLEVGRILQSAWRVWWITRCGMDV
jgi:hypothetical protein